MNHPAVIASLRGRTPDPRAADLIYEDKIVWTVPPHDLEYVREIVVRHARRRRGPVSYGGPGRVVGWSELRPGAKSDFGFHTRRIWVICPWDAADDPTGVYEFGAPIEAVLTSSIVPGQPGRSVWRGRVARRRMPAGSNAAGSP